MSNISLIIVDDHKMFLDGLMAILSNEPEITVLATAKNGIEALKVLALHEPDLIITDISMPEMNGIEFIKKAKLLRPDAKIVVVSMFDRIQSFDHIDGYLLKETGYDELLKAIKSIVIDGEKYFKKEVIEEVNLEFNKTILTKREKEIVVLIANELTTDEIAEKLFLSKHTVETHKKNIFLKLKVNNAAGLIKRAIYLGYM